MVGDWDDVYAAALVGTEQADCAIVRVLESTEKTWKAEIKSVRDEHGTLTAFRCHGRCTGTPEQLADANITLVCSLGVFGNAETEQDILVKTTRRLRDLHGVEFAPIR